MVRRRNDSINLAKTRLNRQNKELRSVSTAYTALRSLKHVASVIQPISRRSSCEVYDAHLVNLTELEQRYETDFQNGLANSQVVYLNRKHGPNKIKDLRGKSTWKLFCGMIFGGFSIVLWAAFILSVIAFCFKKDSNIYARMDDLYLCIIILAVLLGANTYALIQEIRFKLIVKHNKEQLSRSAVVLRGNMKVSVKVEQLVPGDIIYLKEGDWVPADIRILECCSLKVDNSSISGQAHPQVRSNSCTSNNPLETENMLFQNTFIVEGSSKGVIIAIGQRTLTGTLANLTVDVQQSIVPLKVELTEFTILVTSLTIVFGVIFLIYGLCTGKDPLRMFTYFIAIIISNIPSGLLLVLNSVRIIVAKRMSKHCVIKDIFAIETLGQTSVLCIDKTNTITQNKMTVSHLFYDFMIHDVLSKHYVNGYSKQFTNLCRAGVLCNNAKKEGHKIIKGDIIDVAVLHCMVFITRISYSVRTLYPKVFEIPFNPTDRIHVTIHSRHKDQKAMLLIKGEPEKVLERCNRLLYEDIEYDMDNSMLKHVKLGLQELGYMGERVIAFADCVLPHKFTGHYPFTNEPNFPIQNLRFIGFMSMYDPPRPEVNKAIKIFREAGIKVVMITGDYPVTANTMAKKVGIISPQHDTIYDIAMRRRISAEKINRTEAPDATVICGSDLRTLDNFELIKMLSKYKEIVFARVNAEQKLRIVETFQHMQHVVTVVGDGVNDTLALKKANVGISTGITSSKIAREAADVILANEDFKIIVHGIKEGRLIYDNLKKCTAYIISSNIPEVAGVLIYFFLETPKILSIIVIIILNLGTDIWPGISLAYERSESDAMKLPPRNVNHDTLVDGKLIMFAYFCIGTAQTFAGLASWFFTMSMYGFPPEHLIGIQSQWYSEANDVLDVNGFEWTWEDRLLIEGYAVSAYFLSIVLTQIPDVIISKTRRLSIFDHGLHNNEMFKGVIFEACLACFVVYVPGVNAFLGFAPVQVYFLWPAIPFAFFIFTFDEVRKYIIRKNPSGWFAENAYY